MLSNLPAQPARKCGLKGLLVLCGAIAVALFSCRNYAGGWNDGSRLATVEALVD